MEHIAFLNKSRHLLPKILSGEKTVESRWYHSRIAPYDRIKPGELVYFKESGEPISARAKVSRVVQVAGLNQTKVMKLLEAYGPAIGFPKDRYKKWAMELGLKRYAVLIFLRDIQKVKPFQIDKTGFGNMAAWISVSRVSDLKR